VDELQLPTKCYAVDTWTGDEHAGEYGPDVLSDLRAHHDPLYGHFSRLVQSSFDDACGQFADRSVDFLHLDGFHTYEAVRHDFERWLPKLSDRAVVLIHDINARERDFGAWRVWEEVRGEHRHLELLHAHGLGVLAVGKDQPAEFAALLDASGAELTRVRDFFHRQGYQLRLQLLLSDVRAKSRARHEALARTKEALARHHELSERSGRQVEELRSELEELHRELEELRAMRAVRYASQLRDFRARLAKDSGA
jgi:hypothetical protein